MEQLHTHNKPTFLLFTMEPPKSPKKRKIRLQVTNESGSMTNIHASRDASVDEIIELLSLSANELFPDAPPKAIHIFIKMNGNWDTEAMRGTPISDYKPLTKKAARIRVTLDPVIMAEILKDKAVKEELIRSEQETYQAKQAEQGQLNWQTLGYARLLEIRNNEREILNDVNNAIKNQTQETKETKEIEATEIKEAETKTTRESKYESKYDSNIEQKSIEPTTTPIASKESTTTPTPPTPLTPSTPSSTTQPIPQKKVMTSMGEGVLLETRLKDNVHVVELQWSLANNSKAIMYTNTIELTPQQKLQKQIDDWKIQEEKEKKIIELLQMIPTTQLPFEVYNKEVHEPRVHMSDFNSDRQKRKVLSFTLRGKNFTDTRDIELHEDSTLLHLYLVIGKYLSEGASIANGAL